MNAAPDIGTNGLSGTDAARLAGISYRQLDYWAGHGYLPGVDPVGSGHARSITRSQMHYLLRLTRLVKAGIDVGSASAALNDVEFDAIAIPLATGVTVMLT